MWGLFKNRWATYFKSVGLHVTPPTQDLLLGGGNALVIAWKRPIPYLDGFLAAAAQVGDVCRLFFSCVPNAGFATVELNARMLPKCPLTGVQQLDALGNCNDINVVEVSKHGLVSASLDSTFACASITVATRSMRTSAFVPARVLRPY